MEPDLQGGVFRARDTGWRAMGTVCIWASVGPGVAEGQEASGSRAGVIALNRR